MKKIKGRYTLMHNNKPVIFKVDIDDIFNIDINKYEYFESKGVSFKANYFLELVSREGYLKYFVDILYDKRYVEFLLQNQLHINFKIKYQK